MTKALRMTDEQLQAYERKRRVTPVARPKSPARLERRAELVPASNTQRGRGGVVKPKGTPTAATANVAPTLSDRGRASEKRGLWESEHQIQAAFIKWVRLNETKYPALRLSFAVPNAAKRSPSLAAIMKAEGLRAGVPDWWLPVPRGGWSGLVIEFKSKTGRMSDAQRDYTDSLWLENWSVWELNDWQEAAGVVEHYLKKT